MTETGFGRFVDAVTIQYERIFPHPVERVWRAITEPAEIAAWMFAPDAWDLRPAGAWRMGCGWKGTVTVLDPQRRLRLEHALDRPGDGRGAYIEYELEPVAGGTRLVFTHRLPGLDGGLARDPDGIAGGWHEILDRLTEHLDGRPIGAGLPATDFSRSAEAWLAGKAGAPDADLAHQHVLELRREEACNALNRLYRERAAAGAGGQGDEGLARFLNRHTLEFVRVYPHPIERVWRAITDAKELARWFIPTTKWDFREGGAYRFHDDGFMGEIATIDAPRFVRFGSHPLPGQEPGSFFQYELTPVDGGTRLRFVQYAAPGAVWEGRPEGRNDVPWAGGNLGGWHEFWEALGAHLDGVPADSRMPGTRMSELVADWVRKVQIEYGMDPKLGARIRIGLRREERWAELNALYEKIIDETLPPRGRLNEETTPMAQQQTLAREPGSFMRELFRMTPFNNHLGLELGEASLEKLVVRFTKRNELTLPGGTLHGGALAAAIDVAGAYHAGVAIHQRMSREGGDTDRSHGVRTISLNVDYLKALTADAFTATTTILHTGANIVRVRAECVDDRGDLVAVASLNFSY